MAQIPPFIGMLLLAGWSTSGWLSSGHAMRMALDLGLHRALDKLADGNEKQRTDEEERDLGREFSSLDHGGLAYLSTTSRLRPHLALSLLF